MQYISYDFTDIPQLSGYNKYFNIDRTNKDRKKLRLNTIGGGRYESYSRIQPLVIVVYI